jgi:eukaryotic-like serine/threonine-protein kinase
MRGGVPAFLDELTMDLLNPALSVPAADVLVGELSRFKHEGGHPLFAGDESLGFQTFDTTTEVTGPGRRANRKIMVGAVALIVIALAGVLGAIQALAGNGKGGGANGGAHSTSSPQHTGGAQVTLFKPAANQVHLVDDVKGGHNENDTDVKKTVDNDTSTGWRTDQYQTAPNFGNLKGGMGVLIDLGAAKHVMSVKVELATPKATLELYGSSTQPSETGTYGTYTLASADGENLKVNGVNGVAFPRISEVTDSSSNAVLNGQPDTTVRYLVVWITKLPSVGNGKYQEGIQEITVSVQ